MNNENTERIGPDWQPIAEAAREAVETAHAALDALARAWAATPGTPATEKETMTSEDVIEQAARVLSAQTTCDGLPWPSELHYRQARDLDAAGLLARPLPSRDEIAEVIEAEILDFFDWPGLHPDLPLAAADAVLALLKGLDG